jgi:hypothetical protein
LVEEHVQQNQTLFRSTPQPPTKLGEPTES